MGCQFLPWVGVCALTTTGLGTGLILGNSGQDDRNVKKAQRNELTNQEAFLAARLLERAEIELLPTRSLLESATRIAVELDHPAYDCLYLALAVGNEWLFATADNRFVRKLRQGRRAPFAKVVISLTEAAASLP